SLYTSNAAPMIFSVTSRFSSSTFISVFHPCSIRGQKSFPDLRKNLIRDRLHCFLCLFIVADGRLLARRHRTSDAGPPVAIVAQLGFLQSVARVGNAEALFDLQ